MHSLVNKAAVAARKFLQARDGVAGVIFGLGFVPALLVVGAAVDFGRASLVKSALQQATDQAALSVVQTASSQGSDVAQQKAATLVNASMSRYWGANATVTSSYDSKSSTITLTTKASIPTVVMQVAGFRTLDVSSTSAATITTAARKLPICVMVTSPDQNHTLLVKNEATIDFTNCMVQVNTLNWDAVEARGASYIHSKNGENCFVGDIHYGDVVPAKSKTCTFFTDPFASYNAPDTLTCDHSNYVVSQPGTTLNPGTYCGGLLINKSVTFSPGLYYIKDGDFKTVGTGVDINGDGVTFVLTGTGTNLWINSTGTINLKANRTPAAGVFSGFVFYLDTTDPTSKTKKPKSSSSTIATATVNLSGIVYFAGQKLIIQDGANVTVNPGSIIADFILPDDASLNLTGDLGVSSSAEIAMQKTSTGGLASPVLVR